jgi:AAA+ ATPase superfamily predicted ATPase
MRVSYTYHKYQDELERGSADLDIGLKNREIQASEDPRELYFKISNTGQAFAFDISVHIAPTNTAIDFCGNTRADIQLIESGTVAECSFRIMANAPADTTVRGTLTFSDRTGENKSLPFSFPLTIFQEKGEFRPIANPYTVGNPVSKNSNLYFGREDAYQFIDQNILARDEHHTIVCYGLRRTGKTSLLYNISERGFSDSRLVPVMFDMQGIADEADFYLTLSEAVTEALNSPGECQDFESFKQVLRTAKKDLGDRIIVVLVDEFEELQMRVETGKISKDIFSHIRHLMQHEDRLIFLFCGTHQLEEMRADYWSIFFNTAIYIRINYLSPEDTERLIREPVQGQLTYDDLAVEQILKMTSGQPYLTQLICRTLVNDLNEKKKRNYATINDVDDAVEKIISQVDDHFSTYIWRCMTTLERLILSATAEELAKSGLEYANSKAIYDRIKETDTKKPYKETTYMPRSYMKVLDRLVSKDILAEKNVRYRFPVNLLRKWIFARHPLRQVREEI